MELMEIVEPYGLRFYELIGAINYLIKSSYPDRKAKEILEAVFLGDKRYENSSSNYIQYYSRLTSFRRDSKNSTLPPVSFVIHIHERLYANISNIEKSVIHKEPELANSIEVLRQCWSLIEFSGYKKQCTEIGNRSNSKPTLVELYNTWLSTLDDRSNDRFFVDKLKFIRIDKTFEEISKDIYFTAGMKALMAPEAQADLRDLLLATSNAIKETKEKSATKLIFHFLVDLFKAIDKFEISQKNEVEKIIMSLDALSKEISKLNVDHIHLESWTKSIRDIEQIIRDEASESLMVASEIFPIPGKELILSMSSWIKKSISSEETLASISTNDLQREQAKDINEIKHIGPSTKKMREKFNSFEEFQKQLANSTPRLRNQLENLIDNNSRSGIQLLASSLSRIQRFGRDEYGFGYGTEFAEVILNHCLGEIDRDTKKNLLVCEREEVEFFLKKKIILLIKPHQTKLSKITDEPMYSIKPVLRKLIEDIVPGIEHELIQLKKLEYAQPDT